MNAEMGWLGQEAATARLGVRAQTLYAYVSRGRVQARPDPSDPRRSLYSEADVDRLAQRRRTGRAPQAIAASAISWGEPLLRSAISTVHAGRLVYRGEDAVEFARTGTLEATATLLWSAEPGIFEAAAVSEGVGEDDAKARIFALLARLAAAGDPILNRAPHRLHREGARVVRGIMQAVAGATAMPAEALHAQLARGWAAPGACEPLRRALVLLADHELNVSTFAARVTASSGAPLAACVLSGLSALSGPRHGTAGLAVAELVRDVHRDGAEAALHMRLALGAAVPGFGHPLYAGTDPRASSLLESFEAPPGHAVLRIAAEEILGLTPNVDFALSALTSRFALPLDAPFLIFAAARCVGWIAHALEQAGDGGLIRPRARYVGRIPESVERASAVSTRLAGSPI